MSITAFEKRLRALFPDRNTGKLEVVGRDGKELDDDAISKKKPAYIEARLDGAGSWANNSLESILGYVELLKGVRKK